MGKLIYLHKIISLFDRDLYVLFAGKYVKLAVFAANKCEKSPPCNRCREGCRQDCQALAVSVSEAGCGFSEENT